MRERPTFYFRQQPYFFHFKMRFFFVCLFFFSLTCFLGVWQLHRYAEKKELLIKYQYGLSVSAKPFHQMNHGNEKELAFQPVFVEGRYLNNFTILIQNRFHQGERGFDVITPVRITSEKKLLLVNRGWIPASSNAFKQRLDEKAQPIRGRIKLLDERQFILGKNRVNQSNQLFVLQKINIDELTGMTHEDFFPYILRLDPQEPQGFLRDWTMTNIIPGRHVVYAIQWFLLALVILIGFVCFCCEKANGKE
jgi:surfeit locus 1 family protein